MLVFHQCGLACVSQKTRKLNGPEKPFVKLRLAYSVKLVFLYVVKGIKIKITANFCDTEHFRFEDTKRNMSPEKFRVLRETGTWTRFQNCGEGCVCESDTERLFPRELGVFLSHPKKTLFDSNYLICSTQSANTSTVNSMHR